MQNVDDTHETDDTAAASALGVLHAVPFQTAVAPDALTARQNVAEVQEIP